MFKYSLNTQYFSYNFQYLLYFSTYFNKSFFTDKFQNCQDTSYKLCIIYLCTIVFEKPSVCEYTCI